MFPFFIILFLLSFAIVLERSFVVVKKRLKFDNKTLVCLPYFERLMHNTLCVMYFLIKHQPLLLPDYLWLAMSFHDY